MFIIWVANFTSGKKEKDTPDTSTNPMIDVYNAQPDFSKYKQNGAGETFVSNFWNQPNYGGPIADPIRRTGDEETEVIDNGLDAIMIDIHAARGQINGLFNITNVK